MSILWLIIKVILFALLGIVALFVVGLAILLLAPIHYEAYTEKYDELMYDIHFHYLRGIKGSFFLEDEVKDHKVSIFGKILYEDRAKESEVVREVSEIRGNNKGSEQRYKNEKDTQTNRVLHESPNTSSERCSENKKQIKQEVVSEKIIKQPITKDIEHTSKEAAEKVKDETKQKIKEVSASGIKEILLDPLTYHAGKCMIRGGWDILKVIAPKEWDFEIVIGTGDPADTGALIAKLTLLYPIYYSHGIIRGDYEKACLMGGFLIKGKFRLGQIVIRLIRLYLEKDVRTFINLILK